MKALKAQQIFASSVIGDYPHSRCKPELGQTEFKFKSFQQLVDQIVPSSPVNIEDSFSVDIKRQKSDDAIVTSSKDDVANLKVYNHTAPMKL